jgi:hypothetical protein
MTLFPRPSRASSTSPTPPSPPLQRRRRGTIALAAALGTAAVVGVGVAGTTTAYADTATPTPSASSPATGSPSPHLGLHRSALAREIAVDVRAGTGFAARAQKLAATIIDKHPARFAALPAALQADLTALKKATGGDIATDATAIKTKALSGGYGDRIQKFAERVQSRAKNS